MKDYKMHVFVSDFSFKLNNHCIEHKKTSPKITASFCIKYDFLKAALSDDIKHTIDYEIFCKNIKNLDTVDFCCKNNIIKKALNADLNFNINISINCKKEYIWKI